MLPKLSLIIAVYKNTQNLGLIFQALDEQTFSSFEVIVAEDNNGEEMAAFITAQRLKHAYPIQHLSQEDDGFRKNKILNESIRCSKSDYLVFIDGDCIPHRHFLRQHYENREDRRALFGRRVMLSETFTKRLYAEKKVDSINLFNLYRYKSERMDAGFYLPFIQMDKDKIGSSGIWGCNWSMYKRHFYEVNGFDEEFVRPGIGEDVDIEWRLKAKGIHPKYIKFKALIYHLWHKVNYMDVVINEAMMAERKAANKVVCRYGINPVPTINM
jgi:cellulose synthase/poly-beta-1,6-N-acetylglucosamine synthase-like glycosyltransferase